MSTSADRQILNSVVNPLIPLGEGVYDDDNAIDKDLRDNEEDTEQLRWGTISWGNNAKNYQLLNGAEKDSATYVLSKWSFKIRYMHL